MFCLLNQLSPLFPTIMINDFSFSTSILQGSSSNTKDASYGKVKPEIKKIMPWKISYSPRKKNFVYPRMDADLIYLACFNFLHPQDVCWFNLPSELSKTKHKTIFYLKKKFLVLARTDHLTHSPSPTLRKNSQSYLKKNYKQKKFLILTWKIIFLHIPVKVKELHSRCVLSLYLWIVFIYLHIIYFFLCSTSFFSASKRFLHRLRRYCQFFSLLQKDLEPYTSFFWSLSLILW